MGDDDLDVRRKLHALGERAKELAGLHGTTQVMLRQDIPIEDRFAELVALLPPAMQYPEITTAAIRFGGAVHATPGHASTPWVLAVAIETADGRRGEIEVAYREARDEPAFLPEEHTLLQSIAAIVRTVLERDAADRVLHATHERLQLALEAAGMGVWEWDLDANTTRWSEALSRVLGIEGVQATLGHHRELVHPDDRDLVFRRLEQASRGGDALEAFEMRMRRADGNWIHFAATARIVRDDRMRVRRIVVALIDVTERRALEEGLRHAQKQEALGLIASGVAHDLNSLMNVIVISTEVIRETLAEPSPRVRDAIEGLETGSDGCVSLARQLLTFSRRGTFQPAAVDLGLLVLRLEPMLRRLVRSPIRVEARVEGHVGLVWTDAGQCEQVLINLVVNARDALPGRGLITVRAFRIDHGSGEVALEVTDDGAGIDPAIRARIFEPFFTTKDVGRGTGLGLAVVQSVAQRWSGRVEVESEPGRGTTFRVVFPRLPT
jgi:PAS domain S-box-containing protein